MTKILLDISVFIITIFQKKAKKKESFLSEKNVITFNVLLWIYFVFKKGPMKPYEMYPGKFY